jgi:hypothetical protein
MLRKTQRHRQEGVQDTEKAARYGRDQQPGPQVGPVIDREPADHGAERHDALDAEV